MIWLWVDTGYRTSLSDHRRTCVHCMVMLYVPGGGPIGVGVLATRVDVDTNDESGRFGVRAAGNVYCPGPGPDASMLVAAAWLMLPMPPLPVIRPLEIGRREETHK